MIMYKLLPKIQKPNGLVDADVIQRLSDNAFIPFAPDNTDYQAYLAWCKEGNTPLPADEVTQ